MSKIVVVGSLNVDLTVEVPLLPAPGETVLGGPIRYSSGGKGGNQAAAAARLSGPGVVHMVGVVGRDDHGEMLLRDLRRANVDVSHVRTTDRAGTGLAMICVDQEGENTIVVSPGANEHWTETFVDTVPVAPGDVVVCQLEVPLATVRLVVALARRVGARVILNAAPPRELSPELLSGIAILVVNETEAAHVLGGAPRSPEDLDETASALTCDVVVTLGSRGAYVRAAGRKTVRVEAFSVTAVSAVGSGDAFVGALACAVLAGLSIAEAVERACAAGALAATAEGARGGLPDRATLDAFVARNLRRGASVGGARAGSGGVRG